LTDTSLYIYIRVKHFGMANIKKKVLSATAQDLATEFFTGLYAASNNKNLALELHESAVWK